MPSLAKVGSLILEVGLEKQVELDVLADLILKEDFKYFVALALDLLWIDVLRWVELKIFQVPEVLAVMLLQAGESKVLLVGPKISLFECDEVPSSWWVEHL